MTTGFHCVQCTGANLLFSKFLKLAFPQNSGLEAQTVSTFFISPGRRVILGSDAHMTSYVRILGHDYPIDIDVTPRAQDGESSSELRYHYQLPEHETPNGETKKIADEKVAAKIAGTVATAWVPAWVAETQDQVPEADRRPKQLASRGNPYDDPYSDESRHAKVELLEARDKLLLAIHQEQRDGYVPRVEAWDKREPLSRSLVLSNLSLKALSHETELGQLRDELLKIDPWFSEQSLIREARFSMR